MNLPELSTLDVDGAIRETEEAVAGDTRAGFVRKAAVGGGAAVGAGFFTAMLPELALGKPSNRQDIAILKYALNLEYLEAEFYAAAVSKGTLSGAERDIAVLLRDHERAHVEFIQQVINALGAKAPRSPRFDFRDTNEGAKFIPTAFVLENTGTRAYTGQVGRVKSTAVLAGAASIAIIEGRHAGAIAMLMGRNPISDDRRGGITPFGAFERSSSKAKILREVKRTRYVES